MLIEIKNVSLFFGTTAALDNLSLEVQGGAVGLLGPNGAGKSTLLKTLLGFVKPNQGSAAVFGMDVERQPLEIRRQVGYMPEDECLIPGMTAVQLVAYAGELCGMPRRDALQRAHEVLYYVGLDEERYRIVGEYSVGMKQRVKLAQALIHDPKLLLLDEPTNGMDTNGREEMLELVKDIATDKNINVILSSHLLPDVESACEEIIALSHGSVAAHAQIDALRREKGRAYDLKIVGDTDAYIDALERHNYQIELRPDKRLHVTSENGEQTDTQIFFKLAYDTGVQLRQLREVKHTLEDIFADVMRVEFFND
ncbi:ABC transporter ATP-binding protein [Candidatus Poribacteria bacterium]|nr:ABC transporter ATP-binding protein [Candidatus Poribacteria bacterium]MXY27128.1 ABC transporter ATP-binding protein [Candidatus Poribacteria bacterium]MYK20471.1 ABC transporter ATP-binding protein [Candidatus Poribacteria bacterium]